MSLHGKIRCVRCGHPQHMHTGTHIPDGKTACRQRFGPDSERCSCHRFRNPLETDGNRSVISGNSPEKKRPQRGFIIDNEKDG